MLLFVPALTSHQILSPSVFINALTGFIVFSLLSSSIYILNDIIDVEYDRKHPLNKTRPIAAGQLSTFSAYTVFFICFLAGSWLAMGLGTMFLFVAICYIILNLLYSYYLKMVIILDVVFLMSFYIIRLIAGQIPDAIPFSPWLLSFAIFLFFSLALLKRYVDIKVIRENKISVISGRGYSIDDENVLMSLGVASGLISSLVLILYTDSEQAQQFYNAPIFLIALTPVMFYWISRMWLLAARGMIKSDPVVFAIKDKSSYAVTLCFLSMMFLAKYVAI